MCSAAGSNAETLLEKQILYNSNLLLSLSGSRTTRPRISSRDAVFPNAFMGVPIIIVSRELFSCRPWREMVTDRIWAGVMGLTLRGPAPDGTPCRAGRRRARRGGPARTCLRGPAAGNRSPCLSRTADGGRWPRRAVLSVTTSGSLSPNEARARLARVPREPTSRDGDERAERSGPNTIS